MDLGRLPLLMDCLANYNTGVTITPVLVEGPVFGSLYTPSSAPRVDGWEVHYRVLSGGTETAVAPTIAEAVEVALADLDRRNMTLSLNPEGSRLFPPEGRKSQ